MAHALSATEAIPLVFAHLSLYHNSVSSRVCLGPLLCGGPPFSGYSGLAFRTTVDSIRAVFDDVMVDSMMKRLFVDELPLGVECLACRSSVFVFFVSLVGKLSRRSVDVSRGLSLDGTGIWEGFSVSAFPVTGVG